MTDFEKKFKIICRKCGREAEFDNYQEDGCSVSCEHCRFYAGVI